MIVATSSKMTLNVPKTYVSSTTMTLALGFKLKAAWKEPVIPKEIIPHEQNYLKLRLRQGRRR